MRQASRMASETWSLKLRVSSGSASRLGVEIRSGVFSCRWGPTELLSRAGSLSPAKKDRPRDKGDTYTYQMIIRRVVANVLDGIADDLLVVEVCLGGDLTKDHDHASLGGSLAGDLGEGVFLEAGIEDGVGDLIAARLLAVSSGRDQCARA